MQYRLRTLLTRGNRIRLVVYGGYAMLFGGLLGIVFLPVGLQRAAFWGWAAAMTGYACWLIANWRQP